MSKREYQLNAELNCCFVACARLTKICRICSNNCWKLFCCYRNKDDFRHENFGSSSNEIIHDGDNDSIDEGEEFDFPTRVTATLEQYIETWQNAITNYRLYEEYCLEEKYKDVISHIHRVRSEPDTILVTPNLISEIYELAKLRKHIFDAKDLLGLYENSTCDKAIRPNRSKKEVWSVRNPMQPISPVKSDRESSNQLHGASPNNQSKHSSRLSETWAQRLGDISSTQGEINVSSTGISMKLKPKWPDFLTSVTYQVIKRNRLGQRMYRLIKLTEYHLLNIKNGAVISKVYLFSEIRRVTLEDNETIVITLKSGKILIFQSNLAPNITQQLITRIKVRHQLDRIDISEFASTLDYSPSVTASIIQNISMETQNGSDALNAFSHELLDRTIRGYIASYNGRHNKPFLPDNWIGNNDVSSSVDSSMLHESSSISILADMVDTVEDVLEDIINTVELRMAPVEISMESCDSLSALTSIDTQLPPISPLSSSPISTSTSNNKPSSRSLSTVSVSSRNVLAITEGSAEHVVRTEIQRIIFDPETPEGNTKIKFIEKFSQAMIEAKDYKTSLENVRLFIDGMHGHILKKKGVELAQMLQVGDDKKIVFIDVINHPLGKEATPARQVRPSVFEQKSLEELTMLDRDVLSVLSLLIFTVVEEATFIPLRDDILSMLPSYDQMMEEEELQLKKKVFRKRSQEQWGILPTVISPLNWRTAIFELSSLESNITPSMMLNSLARTSKAIYSEYKLAVLPMLSDSERTGSYLSADDLVPIFIFVFCQSDLSHALMNRDLMWNLCHPDQLHGEFGYYLTAYESAVEFVSNETPTDAELLSIQMLSNSRMTRSRLNSDLSSMTSISGKESMHDVSPGSHASKKKSTRQSGLLSSMGSGFRSKRELLRQSFTPS